MALKVFPTHLFYFEGHAPEVEAREISGGVSLSGIEDVVQPDGGGRVTADFTGADLDDEPAALAWRAISALRHPMIVPFGDIRHQLVGDIEMPPGGLPWWDESAYVINPSSVTIAEAAPLRAIRIKVNIGYRPSPLQPGMWVSIDHPSWRHRAYRIAVIEAQTADSATLRLSHPLREAVTVGQDVETVDPRCVMRIEGAMATGTTLGYTDPGNVRFVEDFSYGYDQFADAIPDNSLFIASRVVYVDGEPVVVD